MPRMRGVGAMQERHVIFWISGFLDTPFLADSGGKELDDGLQNCLQVGSIPK